MVETHVGEQNVNKSRSPSSSSPSLQSGDVTPTPNDSTPLKEVDDPNKTDAPYAHFLKDLCTTKRAINVPKRAFLASNVSSIMSNQVPLKWKDSGCPMISIVIRNHNIHCALLDLGASVNSQPFIVYKRLGLGERKATKMVLQLVNAPLDSLRDG